MRNLLPIFFAAFTLAGCAHWNHYRCGGYGYQVNYCAMHYYEPMQPVQTYRYVNGRLVPARFQATRGTLVYEAGPANEHVHYGTRVRSQGEVIQDGARYRADIVSFRGCGHTVIIR